jgi:hypothetical protein
VRDLEGESTRYTQAPLAADVTVPQNDRLGYSDVGSLVLLKLCFMVLEYQEPP